MYIIAFISKINTSKYNEMEPIQYMYQNFKKKFIQFDEVYSIWKVIKRPNLVFIVGEPKIENALTSLNIGHLPQSSHYKMAWDHPMVMPILAFCVDTVWDLLSTQNQLQ